MQAKDWALLDSLYPGASAHGADPEYWLKRSEEVISVSTQSRDIYPVLDHSRGKGSRLYDLAGHEYLDMTSGVAIRNWKARSPTHVS
jgi:4-aminobutyrate aminotransferase-like enzyme